MNHLLLWIMSLLIYQLPCSEETNTNNFPTNIANPNFVALAENNKSDSEHTNGSSNSHQDPNWVTAKLTCALVIVGAIQAFIYWRQSCFMRAALRQSNESSEAQLRAYLSIDTQVTDPGLVKQIQEAMLQGIFLVFVENTGQTPAYDVICYSTWTSFPGYQTAWPSNVRFKTVEEIRDEDGDMKGSRLTLGSRHRTAYRCASNAQKNGAIFKDALGDSMNKKITLYVYGTIVYRDAFSIEPRITEFCLTTFTQEICPGKSSLGFTGYHVHADAT